MVRPTKSLYPGVRAPPLLFAKFPPIVHDPIGLGIAYGPGEMSAVLITPVTARSTVELARARPSTKWICGPFSHNIGPTLTYIAKPQVLTGQTADNFDARQAGFFKITQELENGDYILRDEIITLQCGSKRGGAEFYPNCVQLRVEGGTGSADNEGITFQLGI
ncbi:hypothetical protein BDV93DRAFT_512940 [Ceratobasidium sp. AG-I]|nr:hypothetical protein BDV93DRAFT_512940 [Ceratobasidium sp. AG-I]